MVQPVNGVTLTCPYEPCSKTFVVFPSRLKQAKTPYCSRICADLGAGQARIKRVTLTCAYAPCSQSFEVVPSSNRKYCSHACSELASSHPRVERTTLICAYEPCSQPFEVIPARLKEARYCSRKCQTKAIVKIRYPQTLAERFWSKVKVCEHGRTCAECCWPWQASLNKGGYGQFQVRENGKLLHDGAHLASFFLHHGRWPAEGMQALHTCDNRPCVSFWHLWEGTQVENMQDCVAKDRYANQWPLVTQAQRQEIVGLYLTGDWSYERLGQHYGLSSHAIYTYLQKHRAHMNGQ